MSLGGGKIEGRDTMFGFTELWKHGNTEAHCVDLRTYGIKESWMLTSQTKLTERRFHGLKEMRNNGLLKER